MNVKIERAGLGYEVLGTGLTITFRVLGPIQNNTYVISDGATTVVVDPSHSADSILEMLDGRTLDAIIVTHHHADHTSALAELKRRTAAPVYASEIDTPVIENQPEGYPPAESCKVDVRVVNGNTITLGAMAWKVLVTPGHTPGSMCLFLDASKTDHPECPNILISGDTLFCGSIGRTDFPGGSDKQMRSSLRRLSQLPDDTLVLPGHNSLTTIGTEQNRVFAYFC